LLFVGKRARRPLRSNVTMSDPAPAAPAAPAAAAAAPPARNYLAAPFYRGSYVFDPSANTSTFKGKWAMTKDQLEAAVEGTVNDCEYSGTGRFPATMTGHFFMWMAKKNTKYREKDIAFTTTTPHTNGNAADKAVQAVGKNQFGTFQIEGTVSLAEGANEGTMELYKFYDPKPVKRPRAKKTPVARRRAPAAANGGLGGPVPIVRQSSDRKRKVNSKFMENLTEPEVTLDNRLKTCQRILLKLIAGGGKNKKKYVEQLFYEPIDLAALPTYADDIAPSKPVCLLDVKRRLYKGMYQTYEAFGTDVRRIFHNCFVYNSKDDKARWIYDLARELSVYFEKEFGRLHQSVVDKEEELRRLEAQRIENERLAAEEKQRQKEEQARKRKEEQARRKKKEAERKRAKREKEKRKKEREKALGHKRKKKAAKEAAAARESAGAGPRRKKSRKAAGKFDAAAAAAAGGGAVPSMLLGQIEYLQQQIEALQQGRPSGPAAGGGGGRKKRASATAKSTWSYEDKEQLTTEINNILQDDDKYMVEIMDIIKKHSNALGDDDEGEIELDIDNLSITCLNELNKYVKGAKQKIRRRKAQENTRKRKEAEKKAKEAKAAAMSSAGLAGVPNMSRAAPARHQGGILKESRPSTVAPLAVPTAPSMASSQQSMGQRGNIVDTIDSDDEPDDVGVGFVNVAPSSQTGSFSSGGASAWASLAAGGASGPASTEFLDMHEETASLEKRKQLQTEEEKSLKQDQSNARALQMASHEEARNASDASRRQAEIDAQASRSNTAAEEAIRRREQESAFGNGDDFDGGAGF
jgi:membrane protein involved in colicin uptake